MKFLTNSCAIIAVILNKFFVIGALPINPNLSPCLPNNLAPIGCSGLNNLAANTLACGNPVLTNEPIGILPNPIASASFVPNNLANIESGITNIQFTPVLSELVPSLQYGDITMMGDLPIGGTIKVCGCIPVYGMINVDGAVPSTGTAVVAESFGNQIEAILSNCVNQYFS